MDEPNLLEQAVMNWVSKRYRIPALTAQIATAKVTAREWTKVGFHVEISVDRSSSAVGITFPIKGPEIESSEIEHGACSLIWGNHGYIDAIELTAYGDYFDEAVSQFSLSE